MFWTALKPVDFVGFLVIYTYIKHIMYFNHTARVLSRDFNLPSRYRLCWCAGNFTCTFPSDHRTDVGSFSILGPQPFGPLEQHRTCVSGQTCIIDGLLLESPSDSNSIMVLGTCGRSDAVVQGWPLGAVASYVTASGTSAYWSETIRAEGGQYRLCWCSGRCHSADKFRADLGSMSLIGPAPLQYARTCISGRQCAFDGLEGEGLQVGDSIQLLNTCGTYSAAVGVPLAGNGSAVTLQSGTVSWGSLPITGPGGRYKLCWCSASFKCGLEEFRLEIGTLDVLGPRPLSQDRTCTSGLTCFSPRLTGHHIGLDSRVALLSSCGVGSDSVKDEINSVEWNRGIVSAPGGQYRVCWCMPDQELDPYGNASFRNVTDCSRWAHFQIDVGTLKVIGPAPWNQRQTCISGQTCRLGIQGEGSLLTSRVLILETCGVGATFPGGYFMPGQINQTSTDLGMHNVEEISLASGGTYRLCWCAGTTLDVQNVTQGCLESDQFQTDFGSVDIIGPAPLQQDRTCVSGLACEIRGIQGMYLSEDRLPNVSGDRTLILDTCGILGIAHVIQKLPDAGMVQVVSRSGATVRWNTPLSAAGGEYKLCWCGAYQDCDTSDQFRTSIGTLTLIGPQISHTRTCVSGQTCKLEGLRGHFLSDLNMIAILDTCAQIGLLTDSVSENASESFFMKSLDVSFAASSGASRSASVDFGTITALSGGSYRLCWCPMVEGLSNVTVVVNGTDINRTSLVDCFKVDMGELHLIGPVLSEARTCVSGRACFLDGFQGKWLLDTDRVFVMDTCGQQVANGFDSQGAASVQSIGTVQWALQPNTAPGGQYRLCWCSLVNSSANISHPIPCEAALADAFLTDVGTLQVLGPHPFSQMWTCITGQSCKISGIQGLGLSDSNSIMVLQTCATPALVSGFPMSGLAELVVGEGSEATWVTAVSAPGGIYQLCWCSDLSESGGNITGCTAPEHAVSFGSLTILGPSPLSQFTTCISGQSCRVDGMTGLGWTGAADLIAVMNTCGVTSAISRWGNEGIAEAFLGIDSGASFSWQYETVSAAGGNYRLCWCGGSLLANHSLTSQDTALHNVFNCSEPALVKCDGYVLYVHMHYSIAALRYIKGLVGILVRALIKIWLPSIHQVHYTASLVS